MQQELISMVLEKDEVSWQTILYDLVKTEQMNPWDLDLSALTQKYIITVKQLQETNFRLSGKVLLAAAIMLKMKCDYFQDHDLKELDALFARMDENEGSEFFSEFSYDLFRTNEKIEKEDKVYTFIPLLHLENERKVDMLQTEHFGEISIQLAKPQVN